MLKYSPAVLAVKYTHANSPEQTVKSHTVQAQEQDNLLALCLITFRDHNFNSLCHISHHNLTS